MKTFITSMVLCSIGSFLQADELATTDQTPALDASTHAIMEDLIASKDIFPNDPDDELATLPEDTDDQTSSKDNSSSQKQKKKEPQNSAASQQGGKQQPKKQNQKKGY